MSTGTQIDVVMPQMGVSVSEGTVTKWLKQPGQPVEQDEPLLEISTDKVDTEIPSPGAGVLAQILVPEGETVEVGTLLAVIAPEGADLSPSEPPAPQPVQPEAVAAEPVAPQPSAPPPVTPQPVAPEPSTDPVASQPSAAPAPEPAPAASAAQAAGGNGRTFVSPVVARIASEHGVDPSTIPGTGAGGRVTKKDILSFIESGGTQEVAAPEQPAAEAPPAPAPPPPVAPVEAAAQPAPAAPTAPAPPPAAPPEPTVVAPQPQVAATPALAVTPPGLLPGEKLEPITAMRRSIAEHMRRSLDTSAHVTNVSELDVTRIANLRQRLKPEYKEQGVNLTYLAFIARAVVDATADWPYLNAELRGDAIVTRAFVNLGIAVALEDGKGLIVPVIKNAQDYNLLGTARAIQDIAQRARTKKLLPDDVQGGTITITNPGGYGTLFGTPIISQPQVANVGVYAITKRPIVVPDEFGDDTLAIRSMMYMTVTYDHRLIDGAYAAQFGRDIKDRLESWEEPG